MDLDRAARRVLVANWRLRATVPAARLYPHQWSWDSAFIAIGLRHLSPARAQRELESLFGAQWARRPRAAHRVRPAGAGRRVLPRPAFWRSADAPDAPAVPTSGIVQPPAHALAAWETHRADPAASRSRGFLRRVYPRLVALARATCTTAPRPRRPRAGVGRAPVGVRDGQQPGLGRPAGAGRRRCRRPRSAAATSPTRAAAERPTDADYGRYVRLAARLPRRRATPTRCDVHAFAVEDPLCNALLIAGEHALAAIADGDRPRPGAAPRPRARGSPTRWCRRLYDPAAGMFFPRDVHTGELVRSYSVGGLMPLVVPDLPVAARAGQDRAGRPVPAARRVPAAVATT